MVRVTVTVPAEVSSEVDAWLARGAAANRSRFVQDALRAYLHHLRATHLADEAVKLDDEEEALSLAAFGLATPPPTHDRRR
jgi:Arc/MetJ-type ribon-helix-helix transcriptional regulator